MVIRGRALSFPPARLECRKLMTQAILLPDPRHMELMTLSDPKTGIAAVVRARVERTCHLVSAARARRMHLRYTRRLARPGSSSISSASACSSTRLADAEGFRKNAPRSPQVRKSLLSGASLVAPYKLSDLSSARTIRRLLPHHLNARRPQPTKTLPAPPVPPPAPDPVN